MDAHAGLDAGFLISAEHGLVLAERFAFPFALVEVQDAGGLEGEVRVAGEDPRPVLPGFQGIVGEPAAHGGRREAGVMPLAAAWRASSGQVQRANGVPLAAGSSQARAFTSATTRAGNMRGRPGRGASASPSRPCSQYRRRHLRAVSSQIPSRPAIAEFAVPPAASSTIRARITSRYGAVARAGTGTPAQRGQRRQGYDIRAGRHALHGAARADIGHDGHMAKPPESTKTSLRQRLAARARERWPQLAGITVRWHGEFAYVAANSPTAPPCPMRLRYTGSASTWGFAIYRASHDDYDKSVLPSGYPAGTPQEALDCACGLYLGDTTAWLDPPPPTN